MALVISDLLLTFTAFTIAYWVRFIIALPLFADNTRLSKEFYNDVMLAVIPVWLAIFALTGLYSKSKLLGGTQEYASVFNATTLGMFVLISARFTFPTSLIVARGWVIIAWALTFATDFPGALCPSPDRLFAPHPRPVSQPGADRRHE